MLKLRSPLAYRCNMTLTPAFQPMTQLWKVLWKVFWKVFCAVSTLWIPNRGHCRRQVLVMQTLDMTYCQGSRGCTLSIFIYASAQCISLGLCIHIYDVWVVAFSSYVKLITAIVIICRWNTGKCTRTCQSHDTYAKDGISLFFIALELIQMVFKLNLIQGIVGNRIIIWMVSTSWLTPEVCNNHYDKHSSSSWDDRLNITSQRINSLRPRDAIWWQRSGSTLAQVMACCLTAPSHCLNQCWLIISEVQWQSPEGSFTKVTAAINH